MSHKQDFHTPDYREQLAGFDRLVSEALEAYRMPDASYELVAYTENAVYHVQDPGSGAQYALRFYLAGNMPVAWINAQLIWLKVLAEDAGLRVPRPVDGLFSGTLPGHTQPVYGMLLHWVTGIPVPAEELTLGQLWAIGAYVAGMHRFATSFERPLGFVRPRLDWEGLFGSESPYQSQAAADLIADDQRNVLEAAAAYVRDVMERLGDGPELFGLIHGDLISKNILFDGPAVGVIDFDYCGDGYYLYDLTPILWSSRGQPYYSDYLDALWTGYTSIRPMHTRYRDDVEVFVAARHVASCRWIAMNANHPAIRGRASTILAERVQELRTWLKAGHW